MFLRSLAATASTTNPAIVAVPVWLSPVLGRVVNTFELTLGCCKLGLLFNLPGATSLASPGFWSLFDSFPDSPSFSGFLYSGVPGKLGFSSLIGVSVRVGTSGIISDCLFFSSSSLKYFSKSNPIGSIVLLSSNTAHLKFSNLYCL